LLHLPDYVVLVEVALLQDERDCFFAEEAREGPVLEKSHLLSTSLSNSAELFITKGTHFPPFFADIFLLSSLNAVDRGCTGEF
jgi:hypothetical protein